MLPIQTLDLTVPITKALGVKGQVKLGLDEVVVNVIKLADYTASPYASNPHPGQAAQLQAAVAVNFSGLFAQAPPNAIVVVNRIDIFNENSGASQYTIRWINPVDIATTNLNATATLRDSNAMVQVLTGTRLGTVILRVNHTALLGQNINRFEVLAQGNHEYVIDGGFALYGNDPLGRSGVGVWNETLNESVHATFYVNEFKLPG